MGSNHKCCKQDLPQRNPNKYFVYNFDAGEIYEYDNVMQAEELVQEFLEDGLEEEQIKIVYGQEILFTTQRTYKVSFDAPI